MFRFGRTLQWLFLVPVVWLVTLLSILFFNWWIIFFARRKVAVGGLYTEDWLPWWLIWFQTFDASLDTGWLGGYFPCSYGPLAPPPYWRRKYFQWRWLNRNTAYSFTYYPLGIQMRTPSWHVVTHMGDATFTKWIAVSSDGYWNIRIEGRYGSYNFGWKAWNYWDEDTADWQTMPWGPVWRTQIVCSLNPFKRTL